MGITSAAAATGLEQRSTLDLIRDLNSNDPAVEAKTRTELSRRGITDFHLKFVRRLFDPDPTVRREVVQMLPSLPGLDAAPWLLYLCRDDDAEVRLAAISLIVTTGNPALLERAEAIARADNDPRVQNEAAQIAQFRRQSAPGGTLR
jgi:HEAT repeat protein